MKKQQSGFTLIELIMVIVVLGILAAFAIPKFANLGTDARKATLEAAYGSIKSTAALTHSAWLAKNDPAATTVAVEGIASVAMVASSGYPTIANLAEAAGIDAANFVTLPAAVGVTDTIEFSPKGVSAANQATCKVTYKEPSATAGAAPTISILATTCN